MNIKINKKVIALMLANTLYLTTSGCNKMDDSIIESKVSITNLDEDDNLDYNSSEEKLIIENNKLDNTKEQIKYKIIEEVNNNACVMDKIDLKEKNKMKSKTIIKIGDYQKVKEIGKTKNGWSLVKYNGFKGFIKSNKLKKIGNTYIEIDISDQKLKYFKNNKKVLSTDVVTGKDSTPTVEGLYDVYQKCTDVTMVGRNNSYTSYSKYVLKFFKAYYIHDASWRSDFGGEIYKYNGSHGCVNTPYKKVKRLFKIADLHTPVLIHK